MKPAYRDANESERAQGARWVRVCDGALIDTRGFVLGEEPEEVLRARMRRLQVVADEEVQG